MAVSVNWASFLCVSSSPHLRVCIGAPDFWKLLARVDVEPAFARPKRAASEADSLHSRKPTWNLKRVLYGQLCSFEGALFRFHVRFQRCTQKRQTLNTFKPLTESDLKQLTGKYYGVHRRYHSRPRELLSRKTAYEKCSWNAK